MLRLVFEIQGDCEEVGIIKKALMPEIKHGGTPRSSVNLKHDKNILLLEIDAEDVSAMRASVNSYLRWIKLSLDACRISESR